MVKYLKKVYISKACILYMIFLLLGIYYFITSNLSVEQWVISTKYVGLYLNTAFFILILKRTNLFKSIYDFTKLRLGEEGYTKLLIQSLFANICMYLLFTFIPFFILSLDKNINYTILLMYVLVVTVGQFINEIIVLLVIYFNKSTAYLLFIFCSYATIVYAVFPSLFFG